MLDDYDEYMKVKGENSKSGLLMLLLLDTCYLNYITPVQGPIGSRGEALLEPSEEER